MLRIDFLIFGYRKISVDKKDIPRTLNLLLSEGISVKFHNETFIASEREFKKIAKLLEGKISYCASDPRGAFGLFEKYKSRYGIFLALIVSIFLCFFSTGRVWDIRIDGIEQGKKEEIIRELSEVGLSVGTPWRKIDKSKLEADMLDLSDIVSWINVNQRGTVAYVTVIEKIAFDTPEKHGFANVVAMRDSVIEEITVKSGFQVVKPGQTVKKGEILISGVIPGELGGGFCYAEGSVIGRFSDSISVSISAKEMIKEERERRISEISVNFFDFSFKIFKKYRKTPEGCDIIKEKKNFTLFGKATLPFFIEREYLVFYDEIEISYTKEEMTSLATKRMREELNSNLKNKDLIKIKTYGSFSGDVYTLTTEYVVASEVGKCVEFDVVN